MSEKDSDPGLWEMMKHLDLGKIKNLASNIDLPKTLKMMSEMDEVGWYKVMKAMKDNTRAIVAPPIDGDFYQLSDLLTEEERAIQLKVRKFMEEEVNPIINEYWNKAEFPHELIPKMAALNVCGVTYEGYGCPNLSFVMEGILSSEMARVDASISTFFGVQSGLAMGSIYLCGSEEQRQKWLPPMQKMEKLGAFGLTEPLVGSAVSGGLKTTCRREGDHWVLNGQKKWIGNATFSDMSIIWAQDEADRQVKGFIVESGTPGYKTEKIEGKMALRVVQNALITMKNCKVHEENRLQNANSFKDTAKVLKMTRAGVAWQAVGCARGAYENALRYSQQREQFGQPIGGFQLVQDLLVQMLTNLTSMQTMTMRLSRLQDEGSMTDEQASLAKVHCTLRTREIVSHARELLGGNGILLEYDVARFVADAEAIYSYEGTKEINTLIVGRSITGQSAFI